MKLLRKLYEWVLSLTESKHSNWALFILAFAESSFFPIPPDVLLIALSIGKPVKSFFYATISTVGSVLGGIFGYFIGYGIWEIVKGFFFRYVFSEQIFLKVQELYQHNAFLAVFTAGFTPIPYKVFTIAGGVCQIGLPVLIFASVLSRSARFFLVAGMIWKFGEKVKIFIDKYFNLLTIVFTVLLIGGFLILKKVF
ncbi:MAG: DedA family protein [Elusimicrobia bacterium]|nr:DedA family protein [Elusimicrobiota bacterium]